LNLIAEALGLKQKRAALPRVPSAPPGPSSAAVQPPRPPLMPDTPRTIARPQGDDQSPVPQQATTAGFAQREAQLAQLETGRIALPAAGRVSPAPDISTASPLASLFSSGDDLVRAFVMQEILQPPRSLRPHAPLSAAAFAAPLPPPPAAEPAN